MTDEGDNVTASGTSGSVGHFGKVETTKTISSYEDTTTEDGHSGSEA